MNYGVSCTFYLKHPETNSWTFAGGRNPLEHGFYHEDGFWGKFDLQAA